MIDFVSLAIVGAAVSGVVQFIKTQTYMPARVLVVLLSVITGGVYYFVRNTSIWQPALAILLIANTVYGLFISYFEA